MIARRIAALAFLAIVTFAGVRHQLDRTALAGDFRAFYCAGELARTGAFSYSETALAPCEQRRMGAAFFTALPGVAYPAPLPGYAVAAFIPLSLMNFTSATILWYAITMLAALLVAAMLALLRVASFDAAVMALAIPFGLVLIPVGELPWVALAGIAMLAVGTARSVRSLRIIGFICACSQPQIALAVLVALAALGRRYVIEAVSVVVALCCLSFITIGSHANIEYVTRFLPSHVAAETIRAQQYGVPWIVFQLGNSIMVAQWAGRIAFAIALVATFFYARALARRGDLTGACVIGPALALLGGPFVHEDHLVCAIPAALWLASRQSAFGVFAAIVLALPVESLFAQPVLLLAVPMVSASLTHAYVGKVRAALYAALGTTAYAACIAIAAARFGLILEPALPSAHGIWASYVAQHDVVKGWVIWLVKTPVWLALASVAIGAAYVTFTGLSQTEELNQCTVQPRGGEPQPL
ncbi:MAG: hypothetical protein JO322_00830 [Candidatus Eremiobacteraeota bacterium]|nr:hypothetical protein [Candidatus Eremiobacteraeota bacterium]